MRYTTTRASANINNCFIVFKALAYEINTNTACSVMNFAGLRKSLIIREIK